MDLTKKNLEPKDKKGKRHDFSWINETVRWEGTYEHGEMVGHWKFYKTSGKEIEFERIYIR